MIEMENISIHAWLSKYKIKNELGEILDFKDHLFLFDIYSDNSSKLVCYKSAQIGFSTMAILKSIWIAKQKGMDIIYTMPSSSDMKDFVGGKVNRLITQNPILLEYVKDKDSIEQKQIGNNIIYYRGTFTEKAAIAVSADLNIHDEEDRSNQSVVQQYESRLQHSKYKHSWHFSNPSVEGNGVSRYWARSDQKHWFILCKSCGKEQYLSWPESIDIKKRIFVCKHCGKELSREERRKGKWVKKFKDREYSGYWISLLMAPWITAEEIIKYYETKSAEYFANFVLGLPYVGEGNQVTPDIIYRNCTSEINSQERVVIGCDSGLKKHYVLGNKDGIFYAGIAQDWKEIDSLLKKYERSIAVIDALPDLTEPRRLREKYPGRVFLCHYARDRKTFQLIRWGKNEELGNVVVDRNRGLQMVIDDFANKKIPLQGTQDDWEEFQSHWGTLYKVTKLDTLGVPQSVWETSNGNDHWCHCFVTGTRIITDKGERKIEDIKIGDKVLTRKGFKRVYDSGISGKETKVIEAVFSDYHNIIATPNHKIWIKDKGFITLDAMLYGDIIERCEKNPLLTKELYSEDTQMLKAGQSVFILSRMARIVGKVLVDYTRKFGKILMEKFQKVLLSIIKTITHLITKLETWLLFQEGSISLNTQLSGTSVIKKGLMLTLLPLDRFLINGEKQRKEKSGIVNTQKGLWYYLSQGSLFVLNVIKNLLQKVYDLLSFVLKDVYLVGIHEIGGLHTVYNLSVEDEQEYYANGILVSNSTLYWRVGMDRFKNDGGRVFTGEEISFPTSPTLLPNDEVIWKPRFIYPEKKDD